jgi:hypothetical protein
LNAKKPWWDIPISDENQGVHVCSYKKFRLYLENKVASERSLLNIKMSDALPIIPEK